MAGVAATVTLSAESTVLEAARSQIAGTVSQEEAASLPMNGRNFLDLALLVPGVSPTNMGSTQLFAETSAVPGQGLSIGSQRNFSNNFIVDGLSANDDAAGLSGIPYGVDAVDQFQVVTSGGQAELGRALGGYISVVTKSGTNLVHGDVYGYLRDDSLNATNALLRDQGREAAHDARSSTAPALAARSRESDPSILRNLEQRRLNQSGSDDDSQANVGRHQRQAGGRWISRAASFYRRLSESRGYDALWQTGPPVRAARSIQRPVQPLRVLSLNARGAGGLNAPSASSGLDNKDQSVAFSNTLTLSTRMVNETRVQFVHGALKAPPTDPDRAGSQHCRRRDRSARSRAARSGRVNRMYQFVDNLSQQAGAHALRAGVDFMYNADTITFPRAVRGSYAFSSLPNFLAGTYDTSGFTQTFGETVASQTNPNVGLYVQDEWKARPSLTVNAGFRYDLQMLDTITTDRTTCHRGWVLPGRPTLRAARWSAESAGLFFDRVPLRAVANALLSAGNTTDLAHLRQIGISLSPTQAAAPVFPNVLAAAGPLGHAGELHHDRSASAERAIPGRPASKSSVSSASTARSASAISTYGG